MTSLLLGCGAVLSSRLRQRRDAKRELAREYAEDFEKLKSDNEERVKRLSMQYDPAEDPMGSGKPPPSYDHARRESGPEQMARATGMMNPGTTGMRAQRLSPASRVETRDYAVTAARHQQVM